MATTLKSITNKSKYNVAYLGKNDNLRTGWSAWGFGPGKKYDFAFYEAWTVVTTQGDQALLTNSGAYVIWDDGDYNIKVKHNDDPPYVLVHVDARPIRGIHIEITVEENGQLSASQLETGALAQAG